jgi:hypothetical protein
MTGRRATTAPTGPTPLEEVPPTQPPTTPEPAPEPETTPDEDADRLTAAVLGEKPPAQKVSLSWMPGLPPVDPERLAALVAFAEQQKDCYPLTVHEAIAEVTRRVGAIEKTGRSTEGYRFRGIDQALAALHPILGDVGLVIVPGKVIREQWETRATAKGGTLNVARLLVSYTFVGPDGTRLRAAAWGEGADSGDKATQKAHSQSYKTLVFQTFTIPTEASADDEPDATNEPARPFTAEEQERAVTAWKAARDAATLEALVGVRRRAAAGGLLDVPLILPEDSSLVPLSVLFERRRTELEGAQA